MTEQLNVPRDLARDIAVCGNKDADLTGWEGNPGNLVKVIENRPTGEQNRWSSIHELVIQTDDGRIWKRLYTEGLTEYQDERPFDMEGQMVAFDECRREIVESYRYETIR